MAKIPINISKGTVEKNKEKGIIIGIDLGTTNSLVAYMDSGKPVAVKDPEGSNTLVPSVIYFRQDDSVLVGNHAKPFLLSDPANTIYSVKRLMGKSYNDLEAFKGYFGYKIIDEDIESLVKVRVRDRFFTPIELSARILAQLKSRIESQLDQTVSKAVITVPAYFNDAQRQATRDAGKLAGLDVLRIVNEPTAASLAYGIGLDREDNKTIAVYDLGGGTFDISVLRIEQGIFEVLSTNGNTFLGGDDFDRAIIDHWADVAGLDKKQLIGDKTLMQGLRLKAEHAKIHLSSNDEFNDRLGEIGLSLNRSTFEELIAPFVEQTLVACKNALKDAGKKVSEIEHVVMVGGSTRVPMVKKAVSDFFGQEVYDELNPDEVVALGAAIQADILAGNNRDMLLIDITPLSLGIETVGGLMDVIIPRNSKVPVKAGRQYTTSVDGQTRLKIAVFQGERDLVEDNRKLGEFILKGIPPMPAGLPKIEINFILDADGILVVRAKELRSGVSQSINVKSQYGISEEEMAKMLMDSIQNAKSDMDRRALLEARNEANNIILSAEKFIEQNKGILTKNEISSTLALNEILKKAVLGNDKDLINKAMDDLNEYTNPLAQRVMDQTIKSAIKGKKIG